MNIRKHSLSLIKLNTLFAKSVFLLAMISISNYCYSGIYKWVDDQGNVHYGQQRPASVQSEQMRVQNYAPQDTSSYKRPGLNSDSEENKDKSASNEPETTEKKPESKAEKKQRLAACAQARKNLTRMQSIGRIKSKDKDGNASFISQNQKEQKMQQSSDLISKHCK